MTSQKPVENPDRIANFLTNTLALKWSGSEAPSVEQLFAECTTLVRYEIEYYYKLRIRHRSPSILLRGAALFFGVLGLLAAPLEAIGWVNATKYGYLFFGAAGGFLAANSLFGGTRGHASYVNTQLKLESFLTITVISWGELSVLNSDEMIKRKFELVKKLMTDVYGVILGETADWSEASAKALAAYEQKISQATKGG